MWNGFWEWLSHLFAGTVPEEEELPIQEIAESVVRPQPFTTFRNPFQGELTMTPKEVIRYSFQALESWAYEAGIRRQDDQTPNEFTREIASNIESIGSSVEQLGRLYSLAAYAPDRIDESNLPDVQLFWTQLLSQSVAMR